MNPADTGEAPTRAETETHDPTENGHEPSGALAAPSPVIERLRSAYAAQDGAARRKTMMIVPARYHAALAFRAKPIPFEDFRKEAEKAVKRGVDSIESELNFAAKVICHSCETILLAEEEGGELRPADEVVNEFAGGGPIRFDARLCELLGIEPVPSNEYAIARLVYSNKQAMLVALQGLLAFFTEETAGDEDEDPT